MAKISELEEIDFYFKLCNINHPNIPHLKAAIERLVSDLIKYPRKSETPTSAAKAE